MLSLGFAIGERSFSSWSLRVERRVSEAQREREVHMHGLLAFFNLLMFIFVVFRSRVSRISSSLLVLHACLIGSAEN